MIKQLTEVIFLECFSLDSLKEVEDYVLRNHELLSVAELSCVFAMLETRNKILYDDRIVNKLIYRE